MTRRIALCLFALTCAALPASAGVSMDPMSAGFAPRVPVSLLAQPVAWFDPSRLHLSSTMTVGSGFGQGAQGLQVTSLLYQFRSPLTMRVSLGNAFGSGTADRGSSFFLEGLDLSYQPSASTMFRVQFRDVRSPLQRGGYGYGYGYAADHAFWGD